MREWLLLAGDRMVVRRGLAFSAIVGTVLVAVNHGDALVRGDVTWMRILKIAVTIVIPYCVSTISSVGEMRTSRNSRHPVTPR